MAVREPQAVDASVPFVDLRPAHDGLKTRILAELADLIDTAAFTNGPQVATFERRFASYCRRAHCVGVANGTDALRLALLAAGLEPDDEVVLPANTFAATAAAVLQAGGRPVLADVTEDDYNLDPAAAEAAIGAHTRFLLPVHLYGQLAPVRALSTLARRHELRLIEDACQAHGAQRDGLRAGAAGAAAAFSFYPSKNLGAMGDAGAVVTGDAAIAQRVRMLREHGQRTKYRHVRAGYTSRLDTMQAIVLLHKLPQLERWNHQRRMAAAFYNEALAGAGDLRLPPVPAGSEPVWHLYVVRTNRRASLERFLHERGIGTSRHYPQPLHLAPAFADLGYRRGAFPISEALSAELLSLPLYPGILPPRLEQVVRALRAFFYC